MKRHTWDHFRNSGLLWWVNRTLHLLGWAIVLAYEEDGTFIEAYPARVAYRGFSPQAETTGFRHLTHHLLTNISQLHHEVNE